MSGFANQIISSMPSPVSGNGLFAVNVVVPNTDGSFSAMASKPSTSYSYPLMDPAKLIGSPSHPFMNVGLPAYVTTLYNNVFNINTNLEDDISVAASDDRKYPTSFAVQQYVQSQIAGTQLINGSNNTDIVVTTLNNTLITAVPSSATNFVYSGPNATQPFISLFWMDESPNVPRIGTTKTVMYGQNNYLVALDGSNNLNPTGNLVFLYAGDNSNFVYMGAAYKYYQFVYVGDHLSFLQAYDAANSSWSWLVTNCMGVFSAVVNISSPIDGTEITITNINGAHTPNGLTFGNLA